jgi:hypothetical protein
MTLATLILPPHSEISTPLIIPSLVVIVKNPEHYGIEEVLDFTTSEFSWPVGPVFTRSRKFPPNIKDIARGLLELYLGRGPYN